MKQRLALQNPDNTEVIATYHWTVMKNNTGLDPKCNTSHQWKDPLHLWFGSNPNA